MSKYTKFDFTLLKNPSYEAPMSVIHSMYCSDLRTYLKKKKLEALYLDFVKRSGKKDDRNAIVSFFENHCKSGEKPKDYSSTSSSADEILDYEDIPISLSEIKDQSYSDLRSYLSKKNLLKEYIEYLRETGNEDDQKHLVSFLTKPKIESNPLEEKSLLSFFKQASVPEKEVTVKRHYLNKSKTSWIDVFLLPKSFIPTKEEMDQLWNLHPEEKGKVKIMGNVIETPRWFA